MAKKYTRNQSRIKLLNSLDNVFTRAAVNLVCAVDESKTPSSNDLNILANGFRLVFGGGDPCKVFGHPLGFVAPVGRPASSGFTPSDIVSAVIEQKRRELGPVRGSLSAAKRFAMEAFWDLTGKDEDVLRQIERDWRAGRVTVENLSDDDLDKLIEPYEVVTKTL